MAKAVINLQKESGGIVKISPVDGIGITEVTVPESGELVTKEYVDLKVALAEFIGGNQSLTDNGYQKFPGGLIIQWGSVTIPASSTATVNFPISFPNSVFQYVIAPSGNNFTGGLDYGVNITNTQITLGTAYTSGSSYPKYIAIGY